MDFYLANNLEDPTNNKYHYSGKYETTNNCCYGHNHQHLQRNVKNSQKFTIHNGIQRNTKNYKRNKKEQKGTKFINIIKLTLEDS